MSAPAAAGGGTSVLGQRRRRCSQWQGTLPAARRPPPRSPGAVKLCLAAVPLACVVQLAPLFHPVWCQGGLPEDSAISRRRVLAVGGATTAVVATADASWAQNPFSWFGLGESSVDGMNLDQYGRPVMFDGSLVRTDGGLSELYKGSAKFLNKPKVFLAGSTGELGRRVSLEMFRTGMSLNLGVRDYGRSQEVQYSNRSSSKYEMKVIEDAWILGDRQEVLQEQIGDCSVVVDCAGARFGFDVLRPGVGLDPSEPEKTDLNGTKALVDAAVAKGVKKFIYVSAILVNARALGEEVSESDAFKNWNGYGNVLDCKREAEEYIKKSGLDYTIIRPAPMNNDFPKDVGGIAFVKPDTLTLKPGDLGTKISRDDVSLAILDAVFNKNASMGTFELTGVAGSNPTPRERWWKYRDTSSPGKAKTG